MALVSIFSTPQKLSIIWSSHLVVHRI